VARLSELLTRTYTSEDIRHILAATLDRERRGFAQKAQEVAKRDELRFNWRERVPAKPALGAFPRRRSLEDHLPTEWLLEDPQRLAGVVVEMRRFCADEVRVTEAAAELARRLEIDDEVAIEAIAQGISQARRAARDD
jgi:hypothetical protein